MNKKGQEDSIKAIIGGAITLFFVFIFFGIISPMLSEISVNIFPGFNFLIILSFIVIIVAVIASIIRAFGGRI